MKQAHEDWQKIEKLCEEIINQQQAKLLECGKRIVPKLIQDDLYQPNDFPQLENHPEFRYEEGLLHGVQLTFMALKTLQNEILE